MAIKVSLYGPMGYTGGGPSGGQPLSLPSFRYVQLSWDFLALRPEAGHIGFEAVIHTGTNPDDLTSRVYGPSQIINNVTLREVEFPPLPAPKTGNPAGVVNGSVRALYKAGPGPWDVSGIGTVSTADPVTILGSDMTGADAGSVTADKISPAQANSNNLIPNPNSRIQPKSGQVTTTMEFAGVPPSGFPTGTRHFTWPSAISGLEFAVQDVPCNVGDTFLFQAVASASGTGNACAVDVVFLDTSGGEHAGDNIQVPPGSLPNTGSPGFGSITNYVGMVASCPALRVTARFRLLGTGTASGSVDFSQLYATQLFQATALQIQPGAVNLVQNASFEIDTDNDGVPDCWAVANTGASPAEDITPALHLTGGVDGGAYVEMAWSSNNTQEKQFYSDAGQTGLLAHSPNFGVSGVAGVRGGWQANVWYMASIYAMASGTNLGQGMQLQFFGPGGVGFIGPPDQVFVVANPPLSSAWQRYVYKFRWVLVLPAVDGRITWTISNASGTSGSLFLDQAQVTQSDLLSEWTPGNSVLQDIGASVALAGLEHQYGTDASSAVYSRVFFRGSNDPNTRGGAPAASGLVIRNQFASWNATGLINQFQFSVDVWPTGSFQAANVSDNFDGMRFVEMTFWYTAADVAPFRGMCVGLGDRNYNNPADGDWSNAYRASFTLFLTPLADARYSSSPNAAQIYIQARLWNGYGKSDWMDFSPVNGLSTGLLAPVSDSGAVWSRSTGGSVITNGLSGGGGGCGGAAGPSANVRRRVPL